MSGVTIEIGERPFEVAPYKFAELRKAAPHIDRMNALMKSVSEMQERGEDPPLEQMADLLHELVEILAIGISKIDPAMDADKIEGEIDLSFFNSIRDAVMAILSASGFAPKGEAQALSSQPADERAEQA